MADVLLVVDNMSREYTGMLLIQRYLKDRGISSVICSRFVSFHAYNKYRPKMIVLPHALDAFLPEIKSNCFVAVLPSESGNGQAHQILTINKGTIYSKCYSDCVDLFFAWGPFMSDLLVKEKVFSREQVRITGHPSTDHWLLPSDGPRPDVMGLTTTFRYVNNSIGGVGECTAADCSESSRGNPRA